MGDRERTQEKLEKKRHPPTLDIVASEQKVYCAEGCYGDENGDYFLGWEVVCPVCGHLCQLAFSSLVCVAKGLCFKNICEHCSWDEDHPNNRAQGTAGFTFQFASPQGAFSKKTRKRLTPFSIDIQEIPR